MEETGDSTFKLFNFHFLVVLQLPLASSPLSTCAFGRIQKPISSNPFSSQWTIFKDVILVGKCESHPQLYSRTHSTDFSDPMHLPISGGSHRSSPSNLPHPICCMAPDSNPRRPLLLIQGPLLSG